MNFQHKYHPLLYFLYNQRIKNKIKRCFYCFNWFRKWYIFYSKFFPKSYNYFWFRENRFELNKYSPISLWDGIKSFVINDSFIYINEEMSLVKEEIHDDELIFIKSIFLLNSIIKKNSLVVWPLFISLLCLIIIAYIL